jgi:septum formation protein
MGLPQFVLASASPARRRLLQMVGIEPIVRVSNFDESQIQTENATELVETLARCKAEAIAPQFDSTLIVGCDSVLLLNGEIHGKPENAEVAIARWQHMSGQVGELYTGHAIIDQPQQQILVRTQVTRVYFAQMSDRAIRAYVATGEPLKCAGAFALEGRGGLFVDKIEGCHSNVIGLSLPLLRQMLSQLGYEVTEFWDR